MKKGEGKENAAAVEESKVKKKVAGGKCWRGKWLSLLCVTGEISNRFPLLIFLTFNKRN